MISLVLSLMGGVAAKHDSRLPARQREQHRIGSGDLTVEAEIYSSSNHLSIWKASVIVSERRAASGERQGGESEQRNDFHQESPAGLL